MSFEFKTKIKTLGNSKGVIIPKGIFIMLDPEKYYIIEVKEDYTNNNKKGDADESEEY